MDKENSFKKFTNLYELSKTLRFELKPVWKTLNNLENDWIIQKDKEVEENYNKIKVFFDSLHREFVKQSLENWYLNLLEDFYNSYLELNKNPENKKNTPLQKEFEKSSKSLKKELVSFFDEKWNEWKQKHTFLKKWWIDVLNEKEVLDLMWEFYPEEKELFKKFDKFFTYFSNFKESRKNFYAEDWRAWAVATRTIDENLITFIKNLEDFKKFQNNFYDFVENNFSQEEKQVFELDFYNSCLLQDWIDNYNKILWWYSLENWNKIQWINEKINLFKQNQNHSNSKDIKFPRFKLLYKQILSEKERRRQTLPRRLSRNYEKNDACHLCSLDTRNAIRKIIKTQKSRLRWVGFDLVIHKEGVDLYIISYMMLNFASLFCVLKRKRVVFICIINTNSLFVPQNKFFYTNIKCHFTANSTIRLTSTRRSSVFIKTDKI